MKKVFFGIFCLPLLLLGEMSYHEVKTAGHMTPERGLLRIRLQPRWNMDLKELQSVTLFWARYDSQDEKRQCGPAWGINRHADGRTFVWFYFIDPRTRRDWGIYTPFELKNDRSYEFTLGWQNRTVFVNSGRKNIARADIPFAIELAKVAHFGTEAKKTFVPHLLKWEFLKELPKTRVTASPAPALLKILRDSEEEFSLEMENPDSGIRLDIRPDFFAIKSGGRYFVNCAAPELIPHEMTAAESGRLVLQLPPMIRTAITISATRGNLLDNASFEKGLGRWTSQSYHAGDRVEISNAVAHTGKKSLRLEKQSLVSELVALSERVPVEAGKKYYAAGFYHWARNDLNSAVGMFLQLTGKNGHQLLKTDNRHMLSIPVFQTGSGEWRYSHHALAVPASCKGQELFLQLGICLDGNQAAIHWDDLELREQPRQIKLMGHNPRTPGKVLAPAELERILDRKKTVACAIPEKTCAVITMDGRQESMVPVFTHNQETASIALRQKLKILHVKVTVNCWNSLEGSIWRGPGHYDFSVLDRQLGTLLAKEPEAKIILSFLGLAYVGFGKDHPDSVWVTADGKRGLRWTGNVPEVAHSLISYEVRSEVGKAMYQISRYLATAPVGKAVIGMHLTGGSDGQWYPAAKPWYFKVMDYSEGSRRTVADAIRRQYGDDLGALRRAWRNDKITFEDIRLPRPDEMKTPNVMLDPARGDQWLVDTIRAYHRELVRTVDYLSGEIKRGFGRPILTMIYAPGNSFMAQEELVRVEHVDGFICLPSYLRPRNLGGSAFSLNQPHGSFRLRNKFFLEEVDFRNEYSEILDRYERDWLGMGPGVDGYLSEIRRTFGTLFASGLSGWFMTIGTTGHYIWTGPFEPILGEVGHAAGMTMAPGALDVPIQVAVFMECYNPLYLTNRNRIDDLLPYSQGSRQIVNSGLKFMNYLISDLNNPKRQAARINFFPSATTLTERQIRWIEKNLQKDHNILIFSGNCGQASGRDQIETVRRLTGIRIAAKPEQMVRYAFRDCRKEGSAFRFKSGNTAWLWNFHGPLYYVDDPSAEPVASYLDENLPAVAVKRHGDWTAVYIGGGNDQALTAEFWRSLAESEGVKPYGPEGDVTCIGNGMLMIHAVTSGNKTLRWPRKADVVDLTSGRRIAEQADSLTIPMKFGETRWFSLRVR